MTTTFGGEFGRPQPFIGSRCRKTRRSGGVLPIEDSIGINDCRLSLENAMHNSLFPSRVLAVATSMLLWIVAGSLTPATSGAAESFQGRFFSGQGDVEYLQLLDISRRMFSPDPEFQNAAMVYTPAWNGFVEGPTWGAWWIQNSYGPTFCGLPLLDEPLTTYLQNAQDLWFNQMGDGKRTWTFGAKQLIIPDGQLCDAASPGWFMPKQGDGNVAIHDWGMEFTAAGIVMQAELLLIGRDRRAIAHYLPRLRRCANFIESRRDPKNNLFLAGPAGNLLAPSYAGWKKSDGSFDKAYLAGLSITYIAALDRLIELEKLAGSGENVRLDTTRRELARKGLAILTTDEGYFIKYLDPDGVRHGVYGADRYGYFEAVANHDAICFRVAGDQQAERIYRKIASIPGLRPRDVILTNCPGLDDMYTPPTNWLWKFGTWVNGGHWSTCEARMVMSYYRLGKYEDARRSMRQLMKFARAFRMDSPLVDFGDAVYQPKEPINLCYDNLGPAAAMVRGLMEYIYRADGLVLLPHVPPGITRLEQHFPIRFGQKRLYLATAGSGPVTAVRINGKQWTSFDRKSITLSYDSLPEEAVIQIALGGAEPAAFVPRKQSATRALPETPALSKITWSRRQFPVIGTNTLPLRIGADSRGATRFLGRIVRVRVLGRTLAADEIGKLARDPAAELGRDEALVGDWKPGAVQGKVSPNTAGKDLSAKVVGQCKVCDGPAGPAIELSGEGYLEIAHDARLDVASGCTLDAWICPKQQAPGGGRIIDKSQAGTSNGYMVDTFPGNSLRLMTERGTLSYNAKLKPGVWVHVAATVDTEGGLALYLDGKKVASKTRELPPDLTKLDAGIAHIRRFHQGLVTAGLADSYEAAHARLAVEYLATTCARLKMLSEGKLDRLPGPSQYAADKSYFCTTANLCDGLERTVNSHKDVADLDGKRVYEIWNAAEDTRIPKPRLRSKTP
jgi:hypothetical protein